MDKAFDSYTIIKFINDVVEFRKMEWGPIIWNMLLLLTMQEFIPEKKMSDYLIKKGISLIIIVPFSHS